MRKGISRRTVLRGLGSMVALPLLDAMVPAMSAQTARALTSVRRLGVIYLGMGAVMDKWTPATTGDHFELPPILQPLAPFQSRVVVLSGLDNDPALFVKGEAGGAHGRISPAFLTAVHAKQTDGADFRAGVSIDQIAAQAIGESTPFRSLELGLDSTEFAGTCDAGYSCAYTNTVCWSTPTTPLPMENDPRAVFERLFGDSGSTDPAARVKRLQADRSILDSVMESVWLLRPRIGARDRVKMDEYLHAIRDVERRVQKAEAQSAILPTVSGPTSIPESYDEHAKLMFDLQVLAYQSDMTRVITFMLVRELSGRTYQNIDVPDGHHGLSHHQNDPAKIERLVKVNTYHTSLLAYYLEKLQSTWDGDGSLLDHLLLLYGSGMSNSDQHLPRNLPVVLAGGAAGALKGGRHLQYPKGTQMADALLTVVNKVGVPVESVGNSSGPLADV